MTHTKDTSLAGNMLSSDPFGLNYNLGLPNLVNSRICDYYVKTTYWKSKAHQVRSSLFWNRINHGVSYTSNSANQRSTEYSHAASWLNTASIPCKRLIGARRDTSYQDGYRCRCLVYSANSNKYQFIQQNVQNESDCNNINALFCNARPRTINTVIEEPNDGVVTVSSQRDYPNRVFEDKMDNTNHIQERNSTETKKRLNEMFDGRFGFSFQLDKK